MSPTSRAILQSVISTDALISTSERAALQRVLDGIMELPAAKVEDGRRLDEPLLVTQKLAAKLLSVSRVTVWRLTKDAVLHPVEILPGTWRYLYAEVEKLAKGGSQGSDGQGAQAGPRTAVAA